MEIKIPKNEKLIFQNKRQEHIVYKTVTYTYLIFTTFAMLEITQK